MHAWGHGIFENDAARAFVRLLDDDASGDVPRAALAVIADAPPGEHLRAGECARALAAAEIDVRFGIGLTAREKADLIAFLGAL